jgi:phenylacetate-CoA ligase
MDEAHPVQHGRLERRAARVLHGPDRVSHDVAAKWRATRWWGVDIGDPEIVVWARRSSSARRIVYASCAIRLLRTEILPAFDMSEANLDRFIERIKGQTSEDAVRLPSALAFIARHAEKRNVRLDGLGIRVAFVTSECLYDHQRRQIEKTFGCRVANGYGGRDAGFIAHECPEGSLHITAEDLIVELVDAEGRVVPAGEGGRDRRDAPRDARLPFLRYRTGDVGVLDNRACACGRGLPTLREVQGPVHGLRRRQGRHRSPWPRADLRRADLPNIRTFTIVQESLERTRVSIVPEADSMTRCADHPRGHQGAARPNVAVEVDVVDRSRRSARASTATSRAWSSL